MGLAANTGKQILFNQPCNEEPLINVFNVTGIDRKVSLIIFS